MYVSHMKHGAKINKFFDKTNIEDKKVYREGIFSKEAGWKQANIHRQQMEEYSFSFAPFGSQQSRCLIKDVRCRAKGSKVPS